MKTHFKLLTGAVLDKESVVRKCERVVSYFKSNMKNIKDDISLDMQAATFPGANLPLCLLLFLSYFKKDKNHMFHNVSKTTLPSEVDCKNLPCTTCVTTCGKNFFFE